MVRFIRTEIEGKQAAAYYVVPKIGQDEDSESADEVGAAFKKLAGGSFRGVPAACLHGRMTAGEKESAIDAFAHGEIKLLVSTTVVEVGVDVPAATCMVIESAERFGMAQLHQLRGRVGRGGEKSFCFLLASPTADAGALERLAFFCRHHDGFKIAERDLSLRGPGEVVGMRQTGWDELRIADIVRDAELFREICRELDSMIAG
jgi:ATP-dependent DNA helicase RecG